MKMLKIISNTTILILLYLLFSCTTKPKKQTIEIAQRIEFKDKFGNRHYQGLLVNGKKEGLWIEYDNSCRVKFIKNYQNGIENGVYIQLKINGSIGWVGNYKNGFRDGHWIGFQENNIIRSEVHVNKEKFIGIGKHYDDNGFLFEEFDYDKDSITKNYPITRLQKRTPWQEK